MLMKTLSLILLFVFCLNYSIADIIDENKGNDLKVLREIKVLARMGGREIPVRGKAIQIMEDDDKTNSFVKIKIDKKTYYIDRKLLTSFLLTKGERAVFSGVKSKSSPKKTKSPRVKLSAIQEHYKGPPLTLDMNDRKYKSAARTISDFQRKEATLQTSMEIEVGEPGKSYTVTLPKNAKFKVLRYDTGEHDLSHYYVEYKGKTYQIPKERLQEYISFNPPVFKQVKSDKSSRPITKSRETKEDKCDRLGTKPFTVKREIVVESVTKPIREQKWKTIPFVVIPKESAGVEGDYCTLRPIDPNTGKPRPGVTFKTLVHNLVGKGDGSLNQQMWQMPKGAVEKARERSFQRDFKVAAAPAISFLSLEKEPKKPCPPEVSVDGTENAQGVGLEKCNESNNYLEEELKDQLTPRDLGSSSNMKLCINAALSWRLNSKFRNHFKYAHCNSSDKLISSSKPKPCYSNNYASFVHKQLKELTDCFGGVTLSEILPLVFSESEFGINSFNTNSGSQTLNASGMLGLTQVLIDGIDNHYLTTDKYYEKDNPKCKKLNDDMIANPFKTTKALKKSKEKRNVCKRVSIPDGVRKNLFYTLKKYSFVKNCKLEDGTFSGTVNRMISTFGEKYFESKDLEKIKISLLRMIHNRGEGDIKKFLNLFKADLLKTKGKLHKLWGSPKIGTKLSHDEFNKYFSSYYYHERKKHYTIHKGKIIKPSRKISNAEAKRLTSLEQAKAKRKTEASKIAAESAANEGGIYINKADCFQALMEKQYEKQYGKPITCGSSPLSQDQKDNVKPALDKGSCELEHLKGKVGQVLKDYFK